jgi:hypothetical protein
MLYALRSLFKLALRLVLVLIILPVSVGSAYYSYQGWPDSWRSADWSSTGTLPDPALGTAARVRVYAANTGRWKSIFAVHGWLAVKQADSERWTRYEVVGWGRPVRRDAYAPDAWWYSNPPKILDELIGPAAEQAIAKIESAIGDYRFGDRGTYVIWPGPNSNTFVADIIRKVPEITTELPARALGKDYLGPGWQMAPTPSNSGWQASFGGLIGGALAWEEGAELHILGATIGFDPADLAIKLPSLGRLSLLEWWTGRPAS